jgi:hypothetical protein
VWFQDPHEIGQEAVQRHGRLLSLALVVCPACNSQYAEGNSIGTSLSPSNCVHHMVELSVRSTCQLHHLSPSHRLLRCILLSTPPHHSPRLNPIPEGPNPLTVTPRIVSQHPHLPSALLGRLLRQRREAQSDRSGAMMAHEVCPLALVSLSRQPPRPRRP